jgi:membrane protease YdiL (CAAX protease family)
MPEPPESQLPETTEETPGRASLTRRTVLGLSALFTLVLTLVSWGVTAWLQDRSFGSLLLQGRPPGVQLLYGLAVGLGVSIVTTWVGLRVAFLEKLRRIIREVLEEVRPRMGDLLIVSVGAGWGEELFFRGVLQGYVGIWWAALAFALLHGFIVRLSWGGLLLTAYVFAAGVGLGFLCEHVGLLAAISAHAAYDFVSLCGYVYDWRRAGGGQSPRPE